MTIDKNIKRYLSVNGYTIVEYLQTNEKKGLFVLKIQKNNCFFVLKYLTLQSNNTIKEKFQQEVLFYKKVQGISIFPSLVDSLDNFFILDFFESITIRDYITKKSDLEVYQKLLLAVDVFRDLVNKNNDMSGYCIDNAYRYLYVLTLSTPYQLKHKKKKFIKKIFNYLIYKLLVQKLNFLQYRYKKEILKLRNAFSHNDFHYNNILINDKLEIKFIDFENIKYKGFFEIDILFLIVIIEVYCSANYIVDYRNKIISGNFFLEQVYKLFKIAICNNENFLKQLP